MPEGDTVFRSARAMNDALAGATLERCDIRVPAFATVDLTGETVESVVAVGKHLLHRIGDVTIHSHLKMEGSWHLYLPGTAWRRPAWQARAILGTAERVAIGFQLGVLEIVPRANEDDVIGYLGPDILGPGWDPELALRNVTADPARPIGLALLDQRVIAGLGNVYRNEICFLRGLLPTRPVGEVPDVPGLISLAHRVILANRDRTERSTTGDLRPGKMAWVSQRENKPCLRCGTRIRRGSLGESALTQRDTYFCPRCQT
ncbi:DNA-formamidopyrimidine glycosylase family protein [Glaciihabitans sp. dw_435]|uniref:DNA-formamidopyrimidine glycosylase family protein n=1 Tax=Glaciihabitans sp. dw_435 TaxID=2720081 RepID=UPI001BD59A09|nr:DNA-formamidopyrimidine glycosylase family protein [Glaciihabitans sp. dw_435]